ncbi:MAG: thiamine pyrophosphate-binding protein [Ruminococcus sp.]|jgi:acetolactate synthase-1/2/3 large subunit|nr:thiamine pyrophosphate-binding protein [Ruminococcus sp.]
MKKRVADYIADFLADNGITQLFSVVGGGAMHLNNAFGTNKRLNIIYNHHEQASAIAAEGYSRIDNKIAAVCVTSGPGGTNALTGVLCAWQDSLPMIIISGQVRSDITVESTGLDLRQFGEQEYYIIRSVAPMTKYAVTVNDANMIKYHLEKALYLTMHGRKGPVWIDVPLNIQGAVIETDDLPEFILENDTLPSDEIISKMISMIHDSKRPLIIAGSGIRTSNSLKALENLSEKLNIPIITPTSTVDYFNSDHDNYYGMFGTVGGRCGNFLVQNADLLICLGARMSFKQIGFNYQKFSPDSKKIVVDADSEELKKPTIKIDLSVCGDVSDVMGKLSDANLDSEKSDKREWISYCKFIKSKYSIEKRNFSENISAYRFGEVFFNKAESDVIAVLGNNCAAVSLLQLGIKKQGQRMFGNVNCGTMGYDLPASIGAATAAGRSVCCLTGDGSFQMNIQELQTIVHNKLPVKIVIFNNSAYQAIVQTQTYFFSGVLSGCTGESGVSFPSFEKIANAYGFPFRKIERTSEIESAVDWLFCEESYCILEIVQNESDPIIPKLSSKKLADGGMVSPPIDDLFPFLPEDEYKAAKFENFAGGLI